MNPKNFKQEMSRFLEPITVDKALEDHAQAMEEDWALRDAAPAMLEALYALFASKAIYDEERTDQIITAVAMARAAMAKAKGES